MRQSNIFPSAMARSCDGVMAMLLSLLSIMPHAQAQWYRYAEIPVNAVARDVASDLPGNLYLLTTESKVLRKTQAGVWTDITYWGMIGPRSISADRQGGHIYVGSQFQGLFRSADNGATWQNTWMQTNPVSGHHEGYGYFAQTGTPGVFFASQLGLPAITRFTNFGANGQVRVIPGGLDGLAGALYHTTDNVLLVNTPIGIRRSTDNGLTFSVVATPDGSAIAFVETANGRVYALVRNEVTMEGSMIHSDDRITWHLDGPVPDEVPISLWYEASDNTLWLGTRTGVHRRAADGTEWEPMSLNNGAHVVVELIGDNLGGVYDFSEQYIAQRLDQQEQTWTVEVEGLEGHIDRILLTSANTLLAHSLYTSNSVAVMPAGVPTWSQVHLDESVGGVRNMGLTPDGRIHAATARTLYRSDDDGVTFNLTALPDEVAAQQFGGIGVFTTGQQEGIFLGHTFLSAKLFGSFDQGASWSEVSDITDVAPFAVIEDFCQDALGRMYSLQSGFHTETMVRPFHTMDGGATWQEIPFDNGDLFPFSGHKLHAFGQRTFLVGTREVYEVLPGIGPQIVPIPTPFLHNDNMLNTFKLAPSGRIIIHSWADGVYVSDDDGTSWELLGLPSTTVDDITALEGVDNYDEQPFVIIPRNNSLGIEGGVYYHVPGTTSVNERPAVAGANVFPNPTTGLVTVNATTPVRLLEVRDAAGRLLLTRTPNTILSELDLRGIASGLVFLHLHTDDGPTVQRLVVSPN